MFLMSAIHACLFGSDLTRATVDEEFDARDEGRVVRGKEEGRLGDVFGLPDTAQRDPGDETVFHGRRHAFKNTGVNRARANDVHPDLPAFEVVGPRAGERADGGLACVVGAETLEALYARDRAGHDDRASVLQERKRLLNREEGAADVGSEGLIVIFLGDFTDRNVEFSGARAGVEDVDSPLPIPYGFEEPIEIVEIGGIGADAGDIATDGFDGPVEFVLAPPRDVNVSSFVDKKFGRG